MGGKAEPAFWGGRLLQESFLAGTQYVGESGEAILLRGNNDPVSCTWATLWHGLWGARSGEGVNQGPPDEELEV